MLCSRLRGKIVVSSSLTIWDDRRFPEHRNPGLVILPGANGDRTDMISGLWWMMLLMNPSPEQWRNKRSVLRATGRSISAVVTGTGAMVIRHYRFVRRRNPLEFV